MRLNNRYHRLLTLVAQVLKYFLLFLAGFTLLGLLAIVFGIPQTAKFLLFSLGKPILRFTALVLILMMFTIVFESLRS
jgi:hypothetical protein